MSIAITTQIICFTILSLVILIGALGVVLLESIVYSAFLLGGVFMSVAGLYLLLNASFVAAAQVLVYVGAVNVLIIFAIMLVNKKEDLKPINDIKKSEINAPKGPPKLLITNDESLYQNPESDES